MERPGLLPFPWKGNDMSQRTCDAIGCSKPHRARGLCSTHYNQRLPKEVRHPKVTVPCVVCGRTVRRSDPDRYRPTCSVACRTTVQWGHAVAQCDPYEWADVAERRASRAGCDVVESFDRLAVFERDGWRCQSCDVACTNPDPYALTSATVDHIVPFARGGEHSMANTQTLCLSCNSAKQDRIAA